MEADGAALAGDLGLDLTTRANPTVHGAHGDHLTAASYTIANAIYGRDFDRFAYSRREAP
jgi:hypothetical protein